MESAIEHYDARRLQVISSVPTNVVLRQYICTFPSSKLSNATTNPAEGFEAASWL